MVLCLEVLVLGKGSYKTWWMRDYPLIFWHQTHGKNEQEGGNQTIVKFSVLKVRDPDVITKPYTVKVIYL